MLEIKENHLEKITYFVEVILPLAIGKTFTYRIPQELREEIIIGKRVIVPFGKNKVYSGLVQKIHELAPSGYEAKYILSVLDSEPILSESHLDFWIWISDYYMCHLGEVMKAALPSGLKLESENYLILNQEIENSEQELNERENLILDLLAQNNQIKLSDIPKLLGGKSFYGALKSLINKKLILVREELSKGYKPKIQTFIRLAQNFEDPIQKKGLFSDLEKKPPQLNILLAYLQVKNTSLEEVSKNKLLEVSGQSASVLNTLLKKGIFEQFQKRVSRLDVAIETIAESFDLSENQEKAYQEIKNSFFKERVVLLHGITSSGKTQIYIRLIEDALVLGNQVLYLLPEIALTAQLVNRLRKQFGDLVGIYHSHFNENERIETWEKVLNESYKVVIGARSSLFLPFKNLGLIIIDEEHEPSFKQYDPAPRYNARDAAIYLGKLQKAPVLLGSATPSIESYFLALTGKYGLVGLNERFGGVSMPTIEVVDLAKETKEKTLKYHFSSSLIRELSRIISEADQAILFQNRRGYSPILLCTACGYIPKCIHCDVSLTFHKSTQKLHCHYCGFRIENPKECPVCQSHEIKEQGLGTEKIEEEINLIFPEIRVARMDLDTTRGKNGHWKILSDLEEHRIDVLVGTQMVSKGLDFGKVQLIGVMNADQILGFPDFRAYERGYQILTQVSGRAGRRERQGKVIIQTYSPKHPIMTFIKNGDYNGLYQAEIEERRKFNYPPFTRLIRIICKNLNPTSLNKFTVNLSSILKNHFKEMVLGPEEALIPRIRNYYIQEFMLKLDRNQVSPSLVKAQLTQIIKNVHLDKEARTTLIQIDVDPA